MRPGEAGRARLPMVGGSWPLRHLFRLRLPVCDEASSGFGVQLKVETRRMSMRIAATLALMVLCLAWIVPVIKNSRLKSHFYIRIKQTTKSWVF